MLFGWLLIIKINFYEIWNKGIELWRHIWDISNFLWKNYFHISIARGLIYLNILTLITVSLELFARNTIPEHHEIEANEPSQCSPTFPTREPKVVANFSASTWTLVLPNMIRRWELTSKYQYSPFILEVICSIWYEFVPRWNEFVPGWNEFVPGFSGIWYVDPVGKFKNNSGSLFPKELLLYL